MIIPHNTLNKKRVTCCRFPIDLTSLKQRLSACWRICFFMAHWAWANGPQRRRALNQGSSRLQPPGTAARVLHKCSMTPGGPEALYLILAPDLQGPAPKDKITIREEKFLTYHHFFYVHRMEKSCFEEIECCWVCVVFLLLLFEGEGWLGGGFIEQRTLW